MRVIQPTGMRGSQKWMQLVASQHPDALNFILREQTGLEQKETIQWVSPRENDNWAEYRDAGFLDCLGLSRLRSELAEFWPDRGPQWDALGISSNDTVYLVEAKAHLKELSSTCGAKSGRSLDFIHRALDGTKRAVDVDISTDWLTGFYQYANRLAHLKFLQGHGVKAYLVFVYFLNDDDMHGPSSKEQWQRELAEVYRHLGLSPDLVIPGVINAYIDTRALAK